MCYSVILEGRGAIGRARFLATIGHKYTKSSAVNKICSFFFKQIVGPIGFLLF
jgi:hypothetical protein